jgi:Flp pilus assembly protein TadD
LSPTDTLSRCRAAFAYQDLGLLHEAEKEYRAIIALEPENERYHRYLGTVLKRQGKFTEAVEELKKAVTLNPDDPRVASGALANAYAARNRVADGFEVCLENLLSKPDEARRALRLLRFTQRPEVNEDLSRNWDVLVDTLDRMRPEQDHLLNLLALGYLRGDRRRHLEKARETVLLAVERGERKDPHVLATLAEVQFLHGEKAEAVLTLEEALSLGEADWRWTRQLAAYREAALPEIPSYASVDGVLTSRDAGSDRELLDRFSGDDLVRRYLEGCIFLRSGEYGEAVKIFSDLRGPGKTNARVTRRLAESLREAGDTDEAEKVLREALETGEPENRDIWYLWLSVCLDDLRMSIDQTLAAFPRDTASGIAADLAWLLEAIKRGGPIRINCGASEEMTDAAGCAWGRDRFFVGGATSESPGIPVKGAEGSPVHLMRRKFRRFDRPGYSIPLPHGRYNVVLHFCESYYRATDCRRFDLTVEGHAELEDYDIVSAAGALTATTHGVVCETTDGTLDIRFAPRRDIPIISGIEILPAD